MLMKKYHIEKEIVDSVDLKCLLISNGVYTYFGKDYRLSPNPMTCNSLMLSDKLLKYISQLKTPFRLQIRHNASSSSSAFPFFKQFTFYPETSEIYITFVKTF